MAHRFILRKLAVALALVLPAVVPADAGLITSISGQLELVSQPALFSHQGGLNTGIVNANAIIFSEYEDHAVPIFSATNPTNPLLGGLDPIIFVGLDFLEVGITEPGTYPPDAGPNVPLFSGTRVATYIIHYEASGNLGSVAGSVSFSSDVIAIQFGWGLIRDALFELPNVSLMGATGYELCPPDLDGTCDSIALSADRRTVSFSANVNGATDDMRIFLVPVPEPSTIALIGMALLSLFGFGVMRHRQSH